MAERKSVNKYYPPDWDPSKGSVNKYVGQHPLRDRARKLGQGILIIRFEMPYNIWCGGCNSHIGMGVRYNAEKTKTGMYYTTPIYKFRMKCHLCDNHFEIQTDPKNHDYVILEGARRKEQRWDPKENEQIETEDKAVIKKMATDAMFKLEHGSDDIRKGQKAKTNLTSLESRRDEWKDDYMLNKLARQKFREEKKAIKKEADTDAALLAKSSLDIPLQKESEHDVKLASLIKLRALETYDERQAKKRKEIESQPLFQLSKHAKTDRNLDGGKLKALTKSLKSGNASSPFDRTKMNPLVAGSPLSKETLGIKKKSLNKERIKKSSGHTSCGENFSSTVSDCQNSVDKGDEIREVVKWNEDTPTTGEPNATDLETAALEIRASNGTCISCDRDTSSDNNLALNNVLINNNNNNNCTNTVIVNDTDEPEKEKIDRKTSSGICNSSNCADQSEVRHVQRDIHIADKGQILQTSLSLVSAYSDSDSDS